MQDKYSIHKLNENEFDILIPLMQNCFGLDVNINYFKWKYKDNPSGFVVGFYAKHNDSGEIAAYYGVIPELYDVNNKPEIIYQSCDTMTHSNHRRKGLFQKLALHCFDFLSNDKKLFIYGFGGGQSTPGFIKFGWKELFKIKYYFYPSFFKLFLLNNDYIIELINNVNDIEHLTLRSNQSSSIFSIKNKSIFKWRTSNPLHEYITIGLKDKNNNFISYITYYYENRKITIFDFYFENNSAAKKMLNYLKKKLKYTDKGIIAFLQENSSLSKKLVQNQFITNPFSKGPLSDKTPFILMTDFELNNKFTNEKEWLITSFDNDAL
jgi:hypothetical protein